MPRQRSVRRVAVLIETSRAYGRGLLEGVARYIRERGPWSIYFKPQGLGEPPPPWLKHWDGEQLHQIQFSKPTGEVYELHDQVAMLVRAVRIGGPLSCAGEDGRQSVALCLAAQESVVTGRVVELKSFLGR